MSVVQGLSGDEQRQTIVDALHHALMKLPQSACYDDSAFNMQSEWDAIKVALIAAAQKFVWDARFTRQGVVFIEYLVSLLGYELQRRRVFYAPIAELDHTPQRPFQTYISPSVAQLLLAQFQQELGNRLGISINTSECA